MEAMRALTPILKCMDDMFAVEGTIVIHALVRSSTGHYASYSPDAMPSSTALKEMHEALLETVGDDPGVLTGQFITRVEWGNLYRDDDHLDFPIHATWICDYSRRFAEAEKVTLLFNPANGHIFQCFADRDAQTTVFRMLLRDASTRLPKKAPIGALNHNYKVHIVDGMLNSPPCRYMEVSSEWDFTTFAAHICHEFQTIHKASNRLWDHWASTGRVMNYGDLRAFIAPPRFSTAARFAVSMLCDIGEYSEILLSASMPEAMWRDTPGSP
jgi:hypothetical protein